MRWSFVSMGVWGELYGRAGKGRPEKCARSYIKEKEF